MIFIMNAFFFTWVISYPCESSTISLSAFNSLKTLEKSLILRRMPKTIVFSSCLCFSFPLGHIRIFKSAETVLLFKKPADLIFSRWWIPPQQSDSGTKIVWIPLSAIHKSIDRNPKYCTAQHFLLSKLETSCCDSLYIHIYSELMPVKPAPG